MDIYENLVIGNFLFGLGAEMSRRHLGRAMPDTFIGNLQQRPLDESYADVMVRNPGIFRLIEFKREARRKDKKEVAKRLLLETGMRSSTSTPADFDRLAKTSKSIHWFVESPKDTRMVHTVRVSPYIDLLTIGETSPIPLADFVRNLGEQASKITETEQDMLEYEEYLRLVCECRGSKSAALVIFITASGELQFDPVLDVRDLIRPRWQLIRQMGQYQELVAERYQQKIALSYEHVQEVSRSLQFEDEHSLTYREGHRLSPEHGHYFSR